MNIKYVICSKAEVGDEIPPVHKVSQILSIFDFNSPVIIENLP